MQSETLTRPAAVACTCRPRFKELSRGTVPFPPAIFEKSIYLPFYGLKVCGDYTKGSPS